MGHGYSYEELIGRGHNVQRRMRASARLVLTSCARSLQLVAGVFSIFGTVICSLGYFLPSTLMEPDGRRLSKKGRPVRETPRPIEQ